MRRSSITAPLLVALGALVMFGLGSCQMLGITKMDRLSQFGADLNTGKSHMNENFAKGQTTNYAAVNTQAFWDAIGVALPGSTYQGYSLSVHDYVDPSNVTVDIYGPPAFYNFNIAWPAGGPVPAKFVLVQIGEDWFIKAIYLDGVLTVK